MHSSTLFYSFVRSVLMTVTKSLSALSDLTANLLITGAGAKDPFGMFSSYSSPYFEMLPE